MANKRKMTIRFMDKSKMVFYIPKSKEGESGTVQKIIGKSIQNNQFTVEVEGSLYIFPYSNVKYIRVTPCPKGLPDTTIRCSDSG